MESGQLSGVIFPYGAPTSHFVSDLRSRLAAAAGRWRWGWGYPCARIASQKGLQAPSGRCETGGKLRCTNRAGGRGADGSIGNLRGEQLIFVDRDTLILASAVNY